MKSFHRESIGIALKSIRGQMLRTVLTALTIAVGITALVGILTTIDALQYKIESDFSRLGANTFSIKSNVGSVTGFRYGVRERENRKISYREAVKFSELYSYPAEVSVSSMVSRVATLKRRSEKTNPNVKVLAVSKNYLQTSGAEIERGRDFSEDEELNGSAVVIIGKDILEGLFPSDAGKALGSGIYIGSKKYIVIGILKEKGNSFGFSGDNQALIPLKSGRLNFQGSRSDYTVNIQTQRNVEMESAEITAQGVMRNVRGDRPGESNSFGAARSDSLANLLIDQIAIVILIATLIGSITLLGAAIGLMNIMLVSVTERTREIGIRKSIGASASRIRNQFLMEAILIGQLGGAMGILMGITIGNVMAYFIETTFIIPWIWISSGVILCFFVGLASGYYPAKKAAALDPIDALRYE